MSLSRTVSDFSRKSPIFPTPFYLTLPLKRFPLELGTDARVQKLERWEPDGAKSLKICLAVQTQCRRVKDIQQDIFRLDSKDRAIA